jgi:hypothetical protein
MWSSKVGTSFAAADKMDGIVSVEVAAVSATPVDTMPADKAPVDKMKERREI